MRTFYEQSLWIPQMFLPTNLDLHHGLVALIALVFELLTPSVKYLQNLPTVLFIATMAVTVVIFASPGVLTNPLLSGYKLNRIN